MFRIFVILKNVLSYRGNQGTPLLGRWQLERCNNKLSHKIELSNRDHCGPCGDYAIKAPNKYVDNINIKATAHVKK